MCADERLGRRFVEEVHVALEEALASIRPLSGAHGRGKRTANVNTKLAVKHRAEPDTM